MNQEVSPFQAGDHKAHINRHAQSHSKHKTEKNTHNFRCMRIAVHIHIFLHVMVHTLGNINAVGSRCVHTDVLPRECDILSEPVGFASDYRYIDSFEHPTHIGGSLI